ncbi:hypothetical protein V7122_13150 [Bacillus sp. JJ1532]|uniref:BC1872 family protein n=1 Tax=unclassified Bacillus (in: firmicutes) TaxID=185979 RepID=UPI002FFD64CC
MNTRKIDQLIAENVFGWKTNHFQNIDIISVYADDGEEFSIPDDFCPTEDIADAWKVIKEMRFKGIYFEISSSSCRVASYVMKEDQTLPYNYRQELSSEQCESIEMKDMPLRICMASLKALNVTF